MNGTATTIPTITKQLPRPMPSRPLAEPSCWFVGDPLGGTGGVGRRQAENDVPEAGVDRLADCVPGRAGLVVGDRQVDRAGDGGRVAPVLGAVAVQQRAAADDVVDVAARDVPQVSVLGSDAQHSGRTAADEDRRVGPLDRLRIAERIGETVVGAVEVEGFGLGPQPPDNRARLGEAAHGVSGVMEGQAVRLVLPPSQGLVRS
nr:hypothetical protein [Frankia sp. ACN1ag]